MVKTEILKFRVTPEEKEIIIRKALSSYKSVSRYLRDCALEKTDYRDKRCGQHCRGAQAHRK